MKNGRLLKYTFLFCASIALVLSLNAAGFGGYDEVGASGVIPPSHTTILSTNSDKTGNQGAGNLTQIGPSVYGGKFVFNPGGGKPGVTIDGNPEYAGKVKDGLNWLLGNNPEGYDFFVKQSQNIMVLPGSASTGPNGVHIVDLGCDAWGNCKVQYFVLLNEHQLSPSGPLWAPWLLANYLLERGRIIHSIKTQKK